MKTFKHYLTEGDVSFTPGGVKALVKFLSANCPDTDDFLTAGSTLVRGQRGRIDDVVYRGSDDNYIFTVFSVKTLKNRNPVDTPPAQSQMIDQWFESNGFGKPRSEGVFTVAGEDASVIADMYGSGVVYSIFPVGKKSYVWSDNVDDLYEELITYARDHDVDSVKELTSDHIADMMQGIEWKQATTPSAALAAARENYAPMEIIVLCDEFLCLRIEDRETGQNIKDPTVMARILKGQ